MSQELPNPATPVIEKEPVEIIQNQLGDLIGPVVGEYIDKKEVLLIGVVIIAADGGRRSVLYMPQVKPDMTPSEKSEVEERKSLGQFQAAIQFGKLHTALSEVTTHNLRAAARPTNRDK